MYGDGRKIEGQEREQGIVWVDNVFIDVTYTDQSETRCSTTLSAQIKSVSSDGLTIQVDRNYTEVAIERDKRY